VASYDASINVRVTGTSMVEGVLNRVQELERLVRDVNTRPLDVNRIAGRGELADRFGAATRELNNLKNSFINSERAVENFGTTSNRTIANTTALSTAFKRIADNSDIATAQFREFTVAAQQAALAANSLGRARLGILSEELSFGGAQGRTIGGGGLVQELLAQRTQIPNSIAALEAYQSELLDLQRIVSRTSPEFRELEQAIRQMDVAMGRGGQFGPQLPPVQGPALPANFIPPGRAATGARGGPPPGSLAFNPNAAAENLALGAGFPLLFGGGVGQVAGGLLGSFFGSGFGGQILGSAIGQQLEDALRRISEIGTATKTLNLDALRDSVIAVNSDLDVTIERLIKAGQANAAQTEIAKQVTLQTGLLPEQTAATSQAVNGLGTAWNEVVGAVSGLLSIIGTPFVTALAVIAQGIAKAVQGINYALQLVLRTAPLLALQGKLVTAISNALPAINEEQEKIRAEIEKQTDSYSIQIGLALKVEAIDKRRNKGNSVAAKINNNELDRQEKQLQLNAKVEKEIEAVRLKNKGQKQNLEEDQIKALAEIEKREINRAAAHRRERLELEKINEQYGSILNGLERTAALGEQRTLLAQLAGALTEEEAQILNTLNEQSLVIDTILAKRRQLAELKQGGAGTQQLSALVKEITALENKTIQLDIQVRKESLEQIRRDLESATAAANRQLDIQVNTIQGQNTLYQSQLQLLQAQNSLSLQRIDQEEAFLRKTIETTDNVKTQEEAYRALFVVAEARYKIALFNIKIERAATIAEIESRLQLLDIEVRRQQIKYEELRVLALEAKARGILKQAHLEALQLQGGVVELQKRSYNFAVENAGIQRKIADTFYRQKVEAAGLAYNQEVAALRTERLASGMERAASASMSMQKTTTTTTRTLPTGAIVTDKFGRSYTVGQGSSNNSGSLAAIPFQPFAKGGMVTKPTLGLIGEGGENEFIIPQSKAAGFAANYLSGARGASAIPSGGGGDTMPTINIQTGPVMQQGGQNYVSMPDMERALETLATTLLTNNRTPGGRRFQGVN
jgi:hypothetical protein